MSIPQPQALNQKSSIRPTRPAEAGKPLGSPWTAGGPKSSRFYNKVRLKTEHPNAAGRRPEIGNPTSGRPGWLKPESRPEAPGQPEARDYVFDNKL